MIEISYLACILHLWNSFDQLNDLWTFTLAFTLKITIPNCVATTGIRFHKHITISPFYSAKVDISVQCVILYRCILTSSTDTCKFCAPVHYCLFVRFLTENAYFAGYLVRPICDLHMLYLLRPILFLELIVISPDYALRISLGTFLDFASRGYK